MGAPLCFLLALAPPLLLLLLLLSQPPQLEESPETPPSPRAEGVNTERLWSHSPWSSQDPHGRLLNLHGWRGSVGKQCVYQMAWNQIPGQVRLSEARVSALTAPTSYPCPSQLSPSSSQSLGLSSGLNPAQLLLPFPVPVTVTVMGARTHGGGLHGDPRDKST